MSHLNRLICRKEDNPVFLFQFYLQENRLIEIQWEFQPKIFNEIEMKKKKCAKRCEWPHSVHFVNLGH